MSLSLVSSHVALSCLIPRLSLLPLHMTLFLASSHVSLSSLVPCLSLSCGSLGGTGVHANHMWCILMWRDSLIREMTHSFVTWLIHKWHDSFRCHMTHLYVIRPCQVMWHLNESCHLWMSHVTNESCHLWMSHVTNRPCQVPIEPLHYTNSFMWLSLWNRCVRQSYVTWFIPTTCKQVMSLDLYTCGMTLFYVAIFMEQVCLCGYLYGTGVFMWVSLWNRCVQVMWHDVLTCGRDESCHIRLAYTPVP